jgi:hypothetical protein
MHVTKRYAWLGGVAIAGTAAVALLVGGVSAAAQVPNFSITPDKPAPGDTITVSGVCFGVNPDTGEHVVGDRVDVMLVDHQLDDVTQAYSEFIQKTAATPAADETWSAQLQIPVDAQVDQVFYVVTQCLHRFSGFYQSGSFGVGLPSTSTSTTAPTSDGGGGDAPPAAATGSSGAPTNPPRSSAPSVTGRPVVTG